MIAKMAEESPRNPGQPFTLGGVARYTQARPATLLGIGFLFALISGISLVSLFTVRWAPVLSEAMARLPENSVIAGGALFWPEPQGRSLAANSFLSVSAGSDAFDEGAPVDLILLFGPRQVYLRSMLGVVSFRYPSAWTIELNRATLLPLWGAWELPLVPLLALSLAIGLMLMWFILAVPYSLVFRFFAGVLAKSLSFSAAWKAAVAAQFPGAILMSFVLAVYASGQTSLVLVFSAFAAHLALTLLYLVFTPVCLPKSAANPFVPDEPAASRRPRPRKNPFA